MIVISTHKNPEILNNFLKSIFDYQTENHKILVVETSDSLACKKVADLYGVMFDNTDLKYEIGAYNHAIKKYPNENEYFMFQDSLEIVQPGWENIFRNLSDDKKMVAMAAYELAENCTPDGGPVPRQTFQNLFPNEIWPGEFCHGTLCNSFYLPKKAKDDLVKFGIEKLKAYNKNDSTTTERVLGAMAYCSCGFDHLGTTLGNWFWDGSCFIANTGFTIYIKKIIYNRQ
jgi:hypothetical protein